MEDLKCGKKEVVSASLLDKDFVLYLPTTSPPVEHAGEKPSPAVSVAPPRLRDTSPVPVASEATVQEAARQLAERWRDETGLLGPRPWAQFVAGDGVWMLWYNGPYVSQKGNRGHGFNLFLGSPTAAKRVWGIAFRTSGEMVRMVKSSDAELLQKHHPEMYEWVLKACQLGEKAGLPPQVEVPTRKGLRKLRRQERGEPEPDERKRRNERERYAREREQKLAEFWRSALLVSKEDGEVIFAAVEEAWKAKNPFSIYKQAGEERYAPAVFSKVLGLPEMAIQAWLAQMKMDDVLAEEMISAKTKMRGLRVMDVLREEAKRPSSEKPEV